VTILVINAGSSTVKFGLFDFDSLTPLARGLLDWAGSQGRATITLRPQHGRPIHREIDVPDYRAAVVRSLEMLGELESRVAKIRVVGHRLIHGGEEIRCPVRIDSRMKETIARYTHLAPLHIPAGLEAISATETALPDALQTGLFDTAFFADVPAAAYLYPLPYEWYEEWGIRRFGFHGTSHAYCTGRATEMLDNLSDDLKLIICHLGQGSSATAVRGGVALTNTMGFTPLEGLPMGTRSGTVDPGILLYVQREHGLSADELDEILHKQSGLLGLSGVSSDFRAVEAAAGDGNHRARLALDVYAYRVRALIGSLAVTLGGVDALVFTGGIGENSVGLRAEVSKGLECLGIQLDESRNAEGRPDCDVATDDSPARVLLIHTREELMIAREAKRLAEA
jgi:acetate kinase